MNAIANNRESSLLKPIILTKRVDRLFSDSEHIYQQLNPIDLKISVSYRNQSLGYVASVFGLNDLHHFYPMAEAFENARNGHLHRSLTLPNNVAVPIFFSGYALSEDMRIVNYGKCVLAATKDGLTHFYTATNKIAGAPSVFSTYDDLVESFSQSVSEVQYLGWSDTLLNQTEIKLVARA